MPGSPIAESTAYRRRDDRVFGGARSAGSEETGLVPRPDDGLTVGEHLGRLARAHRENIAKARPTCARPRTFLALAILRENVVSRLCSRVARETAFGVVPLRWRVRCVPGLNVSVAASHLKIAHPHRRCPRISCCASP